MSYFQQMNAGPADELLQTPENLAECARLKGIQDREDLIKAHKAKLEQEAYEKQVLKQYE